MKTDIENAVQKKENTTKENITKENITKENIAQKKEKKVVKSEKEQISVIKNFVGKEVVITLRNGNNLKGKLETVAQYELVITMAYAPVIVMKHAVDYIMLAGEK